MQPFAVLGIDPAWTETRPSGVALVMVNGERAEAVAAAPSYASFIARAGGTLPCWEETQAGGFCDADSLLQAAERIVGSVPVRCVAADIPLSLPASRITCRRVADDEISRKFGRSWCGTHSPTSSRPGEASARLFAGFTALGFRLATKETRVATPNALVEVYPHPALLRLTGNEMRLPYKVSNLRRYYRRDRQEERREKLLKTWKQIIGKLGQCLRGAEDLLNGWAVAPTAHLKAVEDVLDALISAWVGAQYMASRAKAFGDASAAIWVPCAGLQPGGLNPSMPDGS